MKHSIKVISFLSLITLGLTACAPTSQVDLPKKSIETIPLSINARIKHKGLAKPINKSGTLVGYDFKKSFMIPAKKGVFFGFSYTANQAINITHNEANSNNTFSGNLVKSTPVTVKVTHPEIVQSDGLKTTETTWQDTLYFGRDNFTVWQFENDRELVNGKWTIEVFYNQEPLITKNFLVNTPPPMPKKITETCVADLSAFPPFLIKKHQACCTNNEAQACYDFAYRGLERIKDKVGAQLYYGKGCELGDISSCRMAGRLAKDKTKQAYWYNKGCDLKDLDSCLEVDRLPGK